MELVRKESYPITTGYNKQSKLRGVKLCAHQGSILASFFLTFMRTTRLRTSTKIANANALALLHFSENWNKLEL